MLSSTSSLVKVWKICHSVSGYINMPYYYTTKLLGGLIQKIHQSDRAIAGLIFSMYQTGNRTFQNGGCGGDRGLQTFSSKHKAILVQATKDPTLSLVWTCETIWEDQRKLLNMKTAKSLRTAAELQHFIEEPKSNLTRIGKLSRSGMNRFGTTMH